MLLAWRNDAETRANSCNHAVLRWHGHLRWLEQVLVDPTCELLIAERHRVAVGTVRFDRSGSEYVVSWTIAPGRRRRGLGRVMMQLVVERAANRRLRADIARDNEGSMAIARVAGFKMSETAGQMTVWHRPERDADRGQTRHAR
jgi:RimJ/RimL family protein N-acetyltransferase